MTSGTLWPTVSGCFRSWSITCSPPGSSLIVAPGATTSCSCGRIFDWPPSTLVSWIIAWPAIGDSTPVTVTVDALAFRNVRYATAISTPGVARTQASCATKVWLFAVEGVRVAAGPARDTGAAGCAADGSACARATSKLSGTPRRAWGALKCVSGANAAPRQGRKLCQTPLGDIGLGR